MKKIVLVSAAVVAALSIAYACVCEKSFTKDVSDTNALDNSNIVATISVGDGDAVIDMDDASQVYDFADLVVVGTIKEKLPTEMSELSSFPYTPIKLSVDKVIKGRCEDLIDVYVSGGTISVDKFISGNPNVSERAEKMGLTRISRSQQKSKYVKYISNITKEYEVGQRYIIMLKSVRDGAYTVIDDTGFSKLSSDSKIAEISEKQDVLSTLEK